MAFEYIELTAGLLRLPSGWQVAKVKEVAKVNELSIQKNYKHEWIEYIDIASVEKGTIISAQKLLLKNAPSRARRIVQDNDILISSVRPNLEHYVFIKKAKPNMVASTGFAVITAKQAEPRFLYYYLITKPFTNYLTRIADSHTSAYPSFNPDVIENADLILPPENEQKAIASILGALDDKIELNRKMNETLEAMARAIFKSWFVDFNPIPGLGPHKEWQDSPLGKIPKGWGTKSIEDVVETIKGRSYKSSELMPSSTALVTLKSIARGGGYRPDGLKPFTGDYKPEQVLKAGELVIACTDVTQAAEVIGKPAIVRFDPSFETLVASLDLLIVRPIMKYISIPFLYLLFRTDNFQAHIYAHTNGTTVLHLDKKGVPSFKFVCPPDEILQKFSEVSVQLFNKIENNEIESNQLASIRDALLPKLLSGEIRVKDAERFAEKRI